MDAGRSGTDRGENRFDSLHAEAKALLGQAANSLSSVRELYRQAYLGELGRWQELGDELDELERLPPPAAGDGAGEEGAAAAAAEAGAEDARRRALRAEAERLTRDVGSHQQELAKVELAQQSLERTWLFLERGDSSLLTDPSEPVDGTDLRMRIVEAQEAERSRLAQEIHDGPAQALTNAIFQVEYVERVLERDPRQVPMELRLLRELLRRELGDVRGYISQLRPPLLDRLGLDGALRDAIENAKALTGIAVEAELEAPGDELPEAARTVVLRVLQEALQNIRKHAAATSVRVTTRIDDGEWVLEVHDDGRGFEPSLVAARGRRNFGLQFMQERAELIGARLEVRSRPERGTIVRLAVPLAGERST
ncbi:MAG TPA: sensor histidine kinase [Candidatus Dormibacteraeota bacterium]|nr:sensor histidine kinase [Candidatus Dormibacteraeota bacterium]